MDYLGATTSTCAQCGRLLPAQVWVRDEAVWFTKHCPAHGAQEARVYSDARQYLDLARFHRPAAMPLKFSAERREACPQSCGLCPDHEQHVCMPIIEITDRCDMECPVCLVGAERRTIGGSPMPQERSRRDIAAMLDKLIETEGHIDVLNLSGGEPTTHPDFREIVNDCTSRRGILYVSVSTNGRRLARDEDLLRFLADKRIIISLQFDGLDGDAHRAMRGEDLLAEKLRLIEAIGRAGARMSLTATVARRINDSRLGEIAQLLFDHDHILSLMFQPMAYIGRGAAMDRPVDPVTIPDVVASLNGAAGGMVKSADFSPLPCSHPACFSLAFYLRTGPRDFIPIKQLVDAEKYLDLTQNRSLFGTDADSFTQIRDAVYALWSGSAAAAPDSKKALAAVKSLLRSITSCGPYCATTAASVAERSIKSIFIHHFMDRHNFDLSRARKCCQVYPQPDGRLVPACVHNCLERGREGERPREPQAAAARTEPRPPAP